MGKPFMIVNNEEYMKSIHKSTNGILEMLRKTGLYHARECVCVRERETDNWF